MDVYGLFSQEEIEEIKNLKELTSDSTINGEDVFCFDLLYQILIKSKDINCVSSEILLMTCTQIKGCTELLDSFGFLNLKDLKSILNKTKKIVMNELKSRKTT